MTVNSLAGHAAILVATVTAALLPAAAQAQPSASEVNRRIDQAAHQLETVVERYNEIRVDLGTNQARVRALTAEMDVLEREVDSRRGRVADLAASTYRANGARPVATLLSTASAEKFVDQLMMASFITREQEKAVAGLRTARDRGELAHRTVSALIIQQQIQEQHLAAQKHQIEREIQHLTQLRDRQRAAVNRSRGAAASRARAAAPSATTSRPAAASGRAGVAVAYAYAQLGKPYRWGAAGPGSYDCSGLTLAAWAKAGVRLPHNARRQFSTVARIGRSQLRPGDLVFFYSNIQHVGIYVGDGNMIHSPRHGELVRFGRIDSQPIRGYGRPG